ncbi:IS630 family transposase [Antarcticirhabdus aurantiaca]|uniref:IS630 family transposase n=1 Tax=Antarcticirhabdus aurantiaca TaxID=2606717 RepID=A0ACD4NXA4_9HYPH|nr:IS630 family transposase [Jeongeuplla avenae]
MRAARAAHPDKRIALWFQDEARVGQKGRTCHRWWAKGRRPPGLCDQRFEWAYIFGAVEPATGKAFSLVLPFADAAMMSLFLDHFAQTIEDGVHVVMVLDGAGWHGTKALDLPANITLVTLPPYSPELNPVERLWLYLRERFLSLREFRGREHIIDACCQAWNAATDDPRRIRSLCLYPWIEEVNS